MRPQSGMWLTCKQRLGEIYSCYGQALRHRAADTYRVWDIPGRIKLTERGIQRVRLRHAHPRARDARCGFRPLLINSHIEVVLG